MTASGRKSLFLLFLFQGWVLTGRNVPGFQSSYWKKIRPQNTRAARINATILHSKLLEMSEILAVLKEMKDRKRKQL
jgi:hypothetical protein